MGRRGRTGRGTSTQEEHDLHELCGLQQISPRSGRTVRAQVTAVDRRRGRRQRAHEKRGKKVALNMFCREYEVWTHCFGFDNGSWSGYCPTCAGAPENEMWYQDPDY